MTKSVEQAKPFVGGSENTTYSTHYRFSHAMSGRWVAIHIGCYYAGLKWLNQLYAHLKAQIPFEAKFEEPEVVILAGPSYKHMPSVQVHITYKISDEEAERMLLEAGFFEGLEYKL